MEMLMHKKKKKDLKISQFMDIGPGHRDAMKGKKIYDKGKSTDNPNEKDTFMKRTGPLDTPFFKKAQRKTKKRYG